MNLKLQVLHLGKYYPPDEGGIESVTASLARGAVQAGLAVTVLCFGDHARGDEDDHGVKVIRVTQHMRVASQPLSARYFWAALRLAAKADVVHVHPPNMLAALATILVGARPYVVLHWHSDVVGKGWLGRLVRPLERAFLRRADKIICTSQAYFEGSATLRPFAEKVVVVPIGVPDTRANGLPRFTSREEAIEALPVPLRQHLAGRPLILCVGRLVSYKGYDILVEAARRMQRDAAIVIVGTGPLADELRRHIGRSAMHSRVLLAGQVGPAALNSLQDLAAVFCMPSVERSEAFGVALVEAMCCSLPLIATRIPGSGVAWVNQHGETGFNIAPGDPGELATMLDALLGDEALRKRLAAGSRARYELLFTEQRSIDAILTIYGQAASLTLRKNRPVSESI